MLKIPGMRTFNQSEVDAVKYSQPSVVWWCLVIEVKKNLVSKMIFQMVPVDIKI